MRDETEREQEVDVEQPGAVVDDDVAAHDLTREELEARYEMARAEIERLQDQLLRRQAELINFRRRVEKERTEIMTVAQAELLEELLPVIDDFERAVGVPPGDVRTLHDGMQLILRGVRAALDRLGVERFDPTGEAFDPRLHEAVARQPSGEVPEGHILEVYQPGYRLKGRLVRPATVVVSFGSDGGKGGADGKEGAADEAAVREGDDG
jgi:molecular chaperone GrpE